MKGTNVWLRGACLGMLAIVALLGGCDSRKAQGEGTAGSAGGRELVVAPASIPRSAQAALSLANQWKWTAPAVRSYVTTDAVHFEFPSGESIRIPLPADEMLVAAAPYVDRTHPCAVHTMSGCQGELVNETVQVTVTTPDGEVVLSQEMTTMRNGFVEIWLPRDRELRLEVSAAAGSAHRVVRTFPGSETCLTDLQLRT